VRFRAALESRATWRKFTVAFLCCLGTLCGVTSLFAAIYPDQLKTQGWPYIATVALTSAAYAIFVSRPRSAYGRHLSTSRTELRYQIGDLFEQEGHLVIGFSDTFDTEIPDIISRESVQGQFLDRIYLGDVARLDADLSEALSVESEITIETSQAKPRGKRKRYALGTVAVIGSAEKIYFCCAYSRMRNDNVAESSVDQLWSSLSKLWVIIRDRGQLEPVSIAVVGSELARLSSQLSQTDLARLITLSFLTASRQKIVTRRLTVVVHPKNADMVDLRVLAEFIRNQ